MKTYEGEPCGLCRTTTRIEETGKCKKCHDVRVRLNHQMTVSPMPEILEYHRNNLRLSCRRWG